MLRNASIAGDIGDDEQRRDCPQAPCAQRVPAPQQLPLRRSERGLLYFYHGLLRMGRTKNFR